MPLLRLAIALSLVALPALAQRVEESCWAEKLKDARSRLVDSLDAYIGTARQCSLLLQQGIDSAKNRLKFLREDEIPKAIAAHQSFADRSSCICHGELLGRADGFSRDLAQWKKLTANANKTGGLEFLDELDRAMKPLETLGYRKTISTHLKIERTDAKIEYDLCDPSHAAIDVYGKQLKDFLAKTLPYPKGVKSDVKEAVGVETYAKEVTQYFERAALSTHAGPEGSSKPKVDHSKP